MAQHDHAATGAQPVDRQAVRGNCERVLRRVGPLLGMTRRLLGSLVVLLLLVGGAGAVLKPALAGGSWFDSHELARYPLLFDHFRRAFLAGNAYPRWLPD